MQNRHVTEIYRRMAKRMHLENTHKGHYTYVSPEGEEIAMNNIPQEELATIGISYWTDPEHTGRRSYYPNKPNYITENALRHEQGLPLRVFY